MQNNDDKNKEKELFSSINNDSSSSNNNLWVAIAGAAGVAIVGALILAALGIKGILTGIPALLAIATFKFIYNRENSTK